MYIADFHIHSKYSRATSKEMVLEEIVKWAKYKGVNLLGSGDLTYFLWYQELKEKLQETNRKGVYSYGGVDFILTTEISHIYKKKGKIKKVHNIIFISNFEKADKLNRTLEKYVNLQKDGRPILPISAKDIVKIVKDIDEESFIVPAHIWTPHFSLFGAKSGFDSIEECFEDMSDEIFALETGLSSDPSMNWMVSALDRFTLISNSDAHSPWKIGREANVFDKPFTFNELRNILKYKNSNRFLFTIEYFSEEGKYHFNGHRNCKVSMSPEESNKIKNICPVCGKKMTIGVFHRICELSDRPYGSSYKGSIPFKKSIPLSHLIGFALNKSPDSISVKKKVIEIFLKIGNELSVLINIPIKDLSGKIEENIVELIDKMRKDEIKIQPGYDGEYGKIETTIKISQGANT